MDKPLDTNDVEITDAGIAPSQSTALPSIVCDLHRLVESKAKFATIYADPPWPYSNTAARGAAENHYRTLSVTQICSEPVSALAAECAHLHLWTTNAFLSDAFRVMHAWGFRYKSCLVWVKPQLGMGNYWRVSHEFLLLGVRGNLRFQDHTCRSWQLARRTIHSRKPFVFRELIERVSPGPYLELYGREEQPNCGWTVYGNQVERRLF
jgi:N6-adenosine-specific RNA methylase IME4